MYTFFHPTYKDLGADHVFPYNQEVLSACELFQSNLPRSNVDHVTLKHLFFLYR